MFVSKLILLLMQIMFRGDFTYPGWNTMSGGFCGYHTLFRIFDVDAAKYVYLKMSIIGNPWSASPPFYSCMSPYSPNNLPGADSIVTIYAHELTEVCMYCIVFYSNLYGYEDLLSTIFGIILSCTILN